MILAAIKIRDSEVVKQKTLGNRDNIYYLM